MRFSPIFDNFSNPMHCGIDDAEEQEREKHTEKNDQIEINAGRFGLHTKQAEDAHTNTEANNGKHKLKKPLKQALFDLFFISHFYVSFRSP